MPAWALLLSIEPMPLERQVNDKMRMVFVISELKGTIFKEAFLEAQRFGHRSIFVHFKQSKRVRHAKVNMYCLSLMAYSHYSE